MVLLNISAEKTVDLLYNKPIPVSSGISTGYEPTNVGDIMNKGVELDLNGIILRGKDYEWAMNFNLTHYTNKITALDPDLEKKWRSKRFLLYLPGRRISLPVLFENIRRSRSGYGKGIVLCGSG